MLISPQRQPPTIAASHLPSVCLLLLRYRREERRCLLPRTVALRTRA